MTALAAVIPVKSFQLAKGRLSEVMEPDGRDTLAQALVNRVVDALLPHHVAIACDDDQVASWAQDRGLEVVWCPGTDLNGAVTKAYAVMSAAGHERILISHGDLPYPDGLASVDTGRGVVLVPDRHGRGTNVMVLPPTNAAQQTFEFAYGRDSFPRHLRAAHGLGLGTTVRYHNALGIDVDNPDDLAFVRAIADLHDLAPPDPGTAHPTEPPDPTTRHS